MNAKPDTNQPAFPNENKNWLRWLPYLLLLIAAIALALEWDKIPERWPAHWDARGQIDNWATKSVFGVFFPIGLGLILCFLLQMLALFIVANPRSGKDRRVSDEAARRIAVLTSDFVSLIAVAIAFALGSIGVAIPLFRPQRPGLIVGFVFIVIFIGVAAGIRRLMRGARDLKARGMFGGLEGWNGLIYRNPNDPRLWVPKITGVGYTLNFAHRGSWLFMVAILAIPLLIIIVVIVLS